MAETGVNKRCSSGEETKFTLTVSNLPRPYMERSLISILGKAITPRPKKVEDWMVAITHSVDTSGNDVASVVVLNKDIADSILAKPIIWLKEKLGIKCENNASAEAAASAADDIVAPCKVPKVVKNKRRTTVSKATKNKEEAKSTRTDTVDPNEQNSSGKDSPFPLNTAEQNLDLSTTHKASDGMPFLKAERTQQSPEDVIDLTAGEDCIVIEDDLILSEDTEQNLPDPRKRSINYANPSIVHAHPPPTKTSIMSIASTNSVSMVKRHLPSQAVKTSTAVHHQASSQLSPITDENWTDGPIDLSKQTQYSKAANPSVAHTAQTSSGQLASSSSTSVVVDQPSFNQDPHTSALFHVNRASIPARESTASSSASAVVERHPHPAQACTSQGGNSSAHQAGTSASTANLELSQLTRMDWTLHTQLVLLKLMIENRDLLNHVANRKKGEGFQNIMTGLQARKLLYTTSSVKRRMKGVLQVPPPEAAIVVQEYNGEVPVGTSHIDELIEAHPDVQPTKLSTNRDSRKVHKGFIVVLDDHVCRDNSRLFPGDAENDLIRAYSSLKHKFDDDKTRTSAVYSEMLEIMHKAGYTHLKVEDLSTRMGGLADDFKMRYDSLVNQTGAGTDPTNWPHYDLLSRLYENSVLFEPQKIRSFGSSFVNYSRSVRPHSSKPDPKQKSKPTTSKFLSGRRDESMELKRALVAEMKRQNDLQERQANQRQVP